MRLLLVHGRYGYRKVAQMICYYFYKNIILVFTGLYFATYNGYSGQIFFLDWFSTLYNAFFTSWACLFAYLLETDVNDHYSYRYPIVYKAGQLGRFFNLRVFWKWIVLAVWHGVVCFFGPLVVRCTKLTIASRPASNRPRRRTASEAPTGSTLRSASR